VPLQHRPNSPRFIALGEFGVPENASAHQEFRMPAAPVKFAYRVPNVSGGLVTSKIEQRTDWGYDYNRELAVLAENNGFYYALSQVRCMAGYGAEYQHESTSFSLALLLATQRLKVIAAVHPGLWHPGVLAKLGATADHLSGGRFAVNVVSGWFKGEFTALGEGLDRFWRNVRTHTLHDPVAYKRREVGRLVFEGELPEPTWYS
jgi:hypothetical protein